MQDYYEELLARCSELRSTDELGGWAEVSCDDDDLDGFGCDDGIEL